MGTETNFSNRSEKASIINLSGSSTSLARFDNIGVYRKSSIAKKTLANVTLESSKKLVQSLREMNNLNKLMEEKRVDVQKQMFTKSMQYKQERDAQVFQTTRMTFFNEQHMVQTIGNLAIAFALN